MYQVVRGAGCDSCHQGWRGENRFSVLIAASGAPEDAVAMSAVRGRMS